MTPPPLPVPEGVGPILQFEQPGNEGTSDSEGDECNDSEGAPENEGAHALENEGAPPDANAQAVPQADPPSVESTPPRRRGLRFVDELEAEAGRSTLRRRKHTSTNNGVSQRTRSATTKRRTRNSNPKYAGKGIYNYTPEPNGGKPRHKHHQYLAGGCQNRQSRDSLHENARLHGLNWEPSALVASAPDSSSKQILHDLLQKTPLGDWTPLALQAKLRSKDPDTPGWEEAMNGPYAAGYKEAAMLEIETLKKMNVWDEVDRESWMKVLPSTWAFRRKTYPDGCTKKLKGRFCVRGDREIAGVHYDPDRIYAPVVSWTTVRLLLMLSAHLDLATRQVDYVAAFVHSPLPAPAGYETMSDEEKLRSCTYVDMPRGFRKEGKVLRLNKALYGLKSAPKAFFSHLKSNLEAIGFKQAIDVDACLFHFR